MTTESVANEGNAAKYFAQIMHMCDDDLDPYTYRLYGHYVRACGGSAEPCRQSTRTISRITRMSLAKITDARYTLAAEGYIVIHKEEGIDGLAVTLIDRWLENIQRYQKPDNRSHSEQIDDNRSHDEQTVPVAYTPRSPDEHKNNIRENNHKDIKALLPALPFDDFTESKIIAVSDDTAVSQHRTLDEQIVDAVGEKLNDLNPPVKKMDKSANWYDHAALIKAVQDVFSVRGRQEGFIANMLRGRASKDNEWGKCNLPPDKLMTGEALQDWAEWWHQQNPNISIVKIAAKVQSEILLWWEKGCPKAQSVAIADNPTLPEYDPDNDPTYAPIPPEQHIDAGQIKQRIEAKYGKPIL